MDLPNFTGNITIGNLSQIEINENLDLKNFKCINSNQNILHNSDLATKSYVDSNQRNIDNLNAVGFPVSQYSFNGQKLINLGLCVNLGDAANKEYVDLKISPPIINLNSVDGPVLPYSFDNQRLINLMNPINSQDGTTKFYVDNKRLNEFLCAADVDLNQKKIFNLQDATNDGDALTFRQIKNWLNSLFGLVVKTSNVNFGQYAQRSIISSDSSINITNGSFQFGNCDLTADINTKTRFSRIWNGNSPRYNFTTFYDLIAPDALKYRIIHSILVQINTLTVFATAGNLEISDHSGQIWLNIAANNFTIGGNYYFKNEPSFTRAALNYGLRMRFTTAFSNTTLAKNNNEILFFILYSEAVLADFINV